MSKHKTPFRMQSGDQARRAKAQHTQPCHDCPWRRKALPGWLGGTESLEENIQNWLADAHGEAMIECHCFKGAQCAGAAIYRANVCKCCKSPDVLELPKNHEIVFSSPKEFEEHHHKSIEEVAAKINRDAQQADEDDEEPAQVPMRRSKLHVPRLKTRNRKGITR